MGFVVCTININLVMESGTRKGREVRFEPSQFHGLFLWEGRDMSDEKIKEAEELITRGLHRIDVLREHMEQLSFRDVGPDAIDVEHPIGWCMGITTILQDSCNDLQKARDMLIGP